MSNSQVYPVIFSPNKFVNGFAIDRASNTTLTIGAGTARDSNNVMDLTLLATDSTLDAAGYVTAPLTLNIALSGANGIDTGTVTASSFYKIYLIGASTNLKPIACIATLNSSALPTMPSGYDSYRLIGYFAVDASSHILLAYISGDGNNRRLTYDAPQATAITAGNATSYTAVTLSALVPNVDNTRVQIFSALTPSAAGRGVFLQGSASTGDQIVNLGQVTSVVLNNTDTVLSQLASGVAKINYKVSNGSDAVALKVCGFDFAL